MNDSSSDVSDKTDVFQTHLLHPCHLMIDWKMLKWEILPNRDAGQANAIKVTAECLAFNLT
jgi:hypothetical protein